MKIKKILLIIVILLLANFPDANAQYMKVFGGKLQTKIEQQGTKHYIVTGILWMDFLMPINSGIRVTSDAGDDFEISDINNIIITPESENTYTIEIVLPDGTHIFYENQTMEND